MRGAALRSVKPFWIASGAPTIAKVSDNVADTWSMKKLLIISGLILCFPSTASAFVPPQSSFDPGLTADMVMGKQVCTDGVCLTVEPQDQIQAHNGVRVGFPDQAPNGPSTLHFQSNLGYFFTTDYQSIGFGTGICETIYDPLRYGGTSGSAPNCSLVPGTMLSFTIYKRHEFNGNFYATISTGFYQDSNGVLHTRQQPSGVYGYDPAKNVPDCNPSGTRGEWMTLYPGLRGTGYIVNEATAPAGFAEACHLLTAAQAAVEVASYTDETITTPTTVAPSIAVAKVQSCPALTYRGKRVGVTSTGATCTTARTVLAKFVGSKYEAPGWVCVQLRVGTARVASCGTPGKSSKRVVGRWRV